MKVAMLEHFAERDLTMATAALDRELEFLASAHSSELEWAIVGFAE